MDSKKRHIKVIHVHFLHGHKNYYFGSVSGVYRKFTDADIGCKSWQLRHQLRYDGSTYINSLVVVFRSVLLR